jgi:tetratricopeptide (TPR) repeat protein
MRSPSTLPERTLVAGYDDGTLVSWTISSGERKTAPGKGGEIKGLTFGPDGSRLVVGRDEQIDIVEADSMEVLLSFSTPEATAQAAAFSDHGSLVCAGRTTALMIFDSAPPPGGYARRAAARRAAGLLDLYGRNAQVPDPASVLGSRADLLDEDRRDAILYAKAFGISPSQMNSEALGCVRRPDAKREEYELALKRIEAALPYFPRDVYFLRTLALAQLRLGDPARALRTIDRAAAITPTDGEKPWAAYDLVRTVGNSKIGRRQEAEQALGRLCNLVKDPEEAQNVETRNYLAEAQRTLGRTATGDDPARSDWRSWWESGEMGWQPVGPRVFHVRGPDRSRRRC